MAMNTHVTKLSLYNNPISDLSPLQFNTTVTTLSIEYCNVSDLSPLRGNHTIRCLHLSGNRIKDVSPLKDTSIYMLYLRNNKIRDATPLWGLTTLTHISIFGNKHIPKSHIDRIHGMTSFNQINHKLRTVSLRHISLKEINIEHTDRMSVLRQGVSYGRLCFNVRREP